MAKKHGLFVEVKNWPQCRQSVPQKKNKSVQNEKLLKWFRNIFGLCVHKCFWFSTAYCLVFRAGQYHHTACIWGSMYCTIVSDIQKCVLCLTANAYVWVSDIEVLSLDAQFCFSVGIFCTCVASTQLLRPEHDLCWPCDFSDSVIRVVKGLWASRVPHSPLWLVLCAAPPGFGNESVTPSSSFYSSACRGKKTTQWFIPYAYRYV